MKKVLFIVLFLCPIIIYAAERATLEAGQSYLLEDKNITLIKLDSKHDSAIFCVNGKKGIVGEDNAENINEVYIELIRLRLTSAMIDLSYDCNKCSCVECSNEACFDDEQIKYEATEDIIEEDKDEVLYEEPNIIDTENGKTYDAGETVIKTTSNSVQGIAIAILVIIVLFLGVIALWKKTRL